MVNSTNSLATPTITERKAKIKAWLSRANRLELEIIELERARSSACARLSAATQIYSAIGCSASNDEGRMLDAVKDIIKLLEERVEKLTHIQLEIIDAIDQINVPAVRAVMLARYINAMSWDAICAEMHCSVRWAHYLHKDGLEALLSALAPEAGLDHYA